MSKKNHLRGLDKQIREKSPVIDKILSNFDNDDDSEFSAIESAVYGEDSGFDINDVEDMSFILEEYSDIDDDDDDDDYDDYSDDEEEDNIVEDMKSDNFDDEDELDYDDGTHRSSKKKKKKCKDDDECDEDDDDDDLFMDEDDIDLGYESVLTPSKKIKSHKQKSKNKGKKVNIDDELDTDLDEDSDDPDLDYMDGAEDYNFESTLADIDFGEVMKAVDLYNDDNIIVKESLSVVEGINDDFYSLIDDDDL